MSEWRTVDTDEASFRPGTSLRPVSGRRRLIWLGLGISLLAVAALLVLRQQRAERQAALQADLTAHIFQEETERFLGHQDQIEHLMIAEAPAAWQEAYRQNYFNAPAASLPPGPIELQEVEFDGQCALVTLALAEGAQIRHYCLSDEAWRRAPIPASAWGEPQTLTLQNGITLHFRARDRAFAEALVPDLNRFFETLAQHQLSRGEAALAPFEIVIEPQELRGISLQAPKEARLRFNSPWLVSSQALPAEATLRLLLAEALLHRPEAEVPISLPGGDRFLLALQSVFAIHLLLSPEDQARLFNQWQSEIDSGWISPFFAELIHPDQATPAQGAELAARLTAHYISSREGLPALLEIMGEMPAATSWDHLFQPILGRSVVELEQEVAQALGHELKILGPAAALAPAFTGTLSRLETYPEDRYRAYLELPDQAWPLPVELPAGLSVQTHQGDELPPGCIPPDTRLAVEGTWLEAGRRLEATQLRIEGDLALLDLGSAPADTLAYLIQGEPVEDPAGQTTSVAYASLEPNYLSAFRTLLALRPNGILQPLLLINPSMQVLALPMTWEGQLQLLVTLKLEGCDRAWFILYRPASGIVGQWLAPPEPVQWLWRADKEDFIFFSPKASDLVYEIYLGGNTFLPELLGTADVPLIFVGWNIEQSRLVSNVARFQETYLGLFDLDTGEITLRPHNNPLRYFTLSPNGNWVAYLNRAQFRGGPLQRLEVLNMNDHSEALTLVDLSDDQALWPPVWSMSLASPQLAVLAGPVAPDQFRPQPQTLLLVSPEQPGELRQLAQAAEGELFAYPVFCPDGSLLYRSEQYDQYRLMRQQPGSAPETLTTLNWPFQPLACP